MAGEKSTASVGSAARARSRPLRVLVVSQEPEVGRVLAAYASQPIRLLRASTLAEARRCIAQAPVGLAIIDAEQPDGPSVDLVKELSRRSSLTETIMICSEATFESAIRAVRAGATDMLLKPLKKEEINSRVQQASIRFHTSCQQRQKVRRLKRVCKKLSAVRRDVRQQVDILCKDLVSAYQELALQMNQVILTSEFAGQVRGELDLEELLRKALEFLLQKAGATNAAIFLPSSGEEYTLSGYVNYDCTSDMADFLLQQLADTVVPRLADLEEAVHITDPETMTAWTGGCNSYFVDSHLIGFSCHHDDEPLAVVIMYRDGMEPYDHTIIELCEAISSVLAGSLAKLIRIRHRYLIDEEDDDFGAATDGVA